MSKDLVRSLSLINPSNTPIITKNRNYEILVKCKLDGEVMPISIAIYHQRVHEQRGENACFTFEIFSNMEII
jgi:hypothetical protein